ncbi:aminoglycoside phosphotransferase family protein [Streptomyces sp. S.PB5]|uniref:aminoglycoside phosphotransferase family protein n=1 Tax=Streptomyces sp. S.PB5 TaxID=3020844 RepID=UPI0025B178EB|nr:aminoglycoside phosphotransferase family protein [Streptomyces sp. S.PB5]MDN3025498.1 aminoglycoside phosphotransferase family protein [Streptomyces sp. S.PB5]
MRAAAPERTLLLHQLLPPGRRYVALPSRHRPIVVAEDRPAVLTYVREALLSVPPPLPTWLYPAARAALGVPAVRRCVPGLTVPVRDGGAARDDGVDRLLASSGPVLLLDHSHDPDARVVLLLFPPGSARPALVVKVPAEPVGAAAVVREAERLRAMTALPLDEVRPTVPTVVELLRHKGLPALVTTALPGLPMLVGYHRPGHHTRTGPVHADFGAAAAWLAAFQSATAGEPAPLEIPARAPRPPDHRPDDDRARQQLHALHRRLRRYAAPTTAVHGDFWAGNILLREGQVSGVVDWERARTAGSPLADPARFVVAYCEYLDRRTRPGHRVRGHPGLVAGEPGAALAYALDGTGWYPRLVREFLAMVLRRLGLPLVCGRDAVLAELAAVAAEATDPEFAASQLRAFLRLASAEEAP